MDKWPSEQSLLAHCMDWRWTGWNRLISSKICHEHQRALSPWSKRKGERLAVRHFAASILVFWYYQCSILHISYRSMIISLLLNYLGKWKKFCLFLETSLTYSDCKKQAGYRKANNTDRCCSVIIIINNIIAKKYKQINYLQCWGTVHSLTGG